eukprot:PhF_6_TR10778/c0_g1_i1/m.17309
MDIRPKQHATFTTTTEGNFILRIPCRTIYDPYSDRKHHAATTPPPPPLTSTTIERKRTRSAVQREIQEQQAQLQKTSSTPVEPVPPRAHQKAIPKRNVKRDANDSESSSVTSSCKSEDDDSNGDTESNTESRSATPEILNYISRYGALYSGRGCHPFLWNRTRSLRHILSQYKISDDVFRVITEAAVTTTKEDVRSMTSSSEVPRKVYVARQRTVFVYLEMPVFASVGGGNLGAHRRRRRDLPIVENDDGGSDNARSLCSRLVPVASREEYETVRSHFVDLVREHLLLAKLHLRQRLEMATSNPTGSLMGKAKVTKLDILRDMMTWNHSSDTSSSRPNRNALLTPDIFSELSMLQGSQAPPPVPPQQTSFTQLRSQQITCNKNKLTELLGGHTSSSSHNVATSPETIQSKWVEYNNDTTPSYRAVDGECEHFDPLLFCERLNVGGGAHRVTSGNGNPNTLSDESSLCIPQNVFVTLTPGK